jgi:hypothetical protein
MMNEALLTQNTIVSYTGVSDTEVKHKLKRSTYALAIVKADTVHGGIVRNSSTVSLYDTENALNNEKMPNQQLGEAQERGQRTARQQRNSTERG